MTASQIIATVTNDATTALQLQAVVDRVGKALPVLSVDGGIEVGLADDGSTALKVRAVADTLTVAVKGQHGEIGLWVAAAIAATLGQPVVDAGGQALPATSATVSSLLGRKFSEEGKDLAEKLGVILPRFRTGVKAIKF